MREKELVPYETTALRGERMLVVAPHPDDETIGCGGLLALHVAEGRDCRVIVVTDGSAHAGASPAGRREEEVRRALTILGSAEVEFLGIPDRQAEESAAEIASMLAEQIQTFRPDLLLLP
ncbi:MAG TPA: PIG-L family deacetylase, partial [Thermoanaerobaculia bacterium]